VNAPELSFGGNIREWAILVEPNIRDRLTLSLLQVMKFVVYCAVALACVTPMLNLWQAGVMHGGAPEGLFGVAIFEAVVMPLAWVGLSFVLIRRGAWRDGLITALLLCSVVVALGFASWLLVAYTIPQYGNPYAGPANPVGVAWLIKHMLAILALAAATLFLALRPWRGAKLGPTGEPALRRLRPLLRSRRTD